MNPRYSSTWIIRNSSPVERSSAWVIMPIDIGSVAREISSRMSSPFSSAGALYWLASLLVLRNGATPSTTRIDAARGMSLRLKITFTHESAGLTMPNRLLDDTDGRRTDRLGRVG